MEFLHAEYNEASAPPPMAARDFLSADEAAEPSSEVFVNTRAIRWIVFAGNDLPPNFLRTVKEMRMGGLSIGNSCATLTRTTNGLLRRCQLTPMTIGYDFLNTDTVGDEHKPSLKKFDRSKYNPLLQKVEENLSWAYECLPGHEIETLVYAQMGGTGQYDIGIREVTALFDTNAAEPNSEEYKTAMRRGKEYQRIIFPDWDAYLRGELAFFPRTKDLRAYLMERRAALTDETALEIIDVILESNAQFERYVVDKLSLMKDTIESGKAQGAINSFRPHQIEWFKMLDLHQEKFLTEKTETREPANPPSVSVAEFQAQSRKLDALTDAVTRAMPAIGRLAEIAVERSAPAETKKESLPNADTQSFPEGAACASTNARGEACQGAVTKELEGKFYCRSHPRVEN